MLSFQRRQRWFLPSLNPLSRHLPARIFDSILWFEPVKGGIGPRVAEHWEIATDGQSCIFYVRKGHRWHYGDPVTVPDNKLSLKEWPLTIKCPVIYMHKHG
jgi:ABC-type transport system substrate-binding protein